MYVNKTAMIGRGGFVDGGFSQERWKPVWRWSACCLMPQVSLGQSVYRQPDSQSCPYWTGDGYIFSTKGGSRRFTGDDWIKDVFV